MVAEEQAMQWQAAVQVVSINPEVPVMIEETQT